MNLLFDKPVKIQRNKQYLSVDELVEEGQELQVDQMRKKSMSGIYLWLSLVGLTGFAGIAMVVSSGYGSVDPETNRLNPELTERSAAAYENNSMGSVVLRAPSQVAVLLINPDNERLGKDDHGQDYRELTGGEFGLELLENEDADGEMVWEYLVKKASEGEYRVLVYQKNPEEIELELSARDGGEVVYEEVLIAPPQEQSEWVLELVEGRVRIRMLGEVLEPQGNEVDS